MAIPSVVVVAAPGIWVYCLVVFRYSLLVPARCFVAVSHDEVEFRIDFVFEDFLGSEESLLEVALIVEGLGDVEMVLELDFGGCLDGGRLDGLDLGENSV